MRLTSVIWLARLDAAPLPAISILLLTVVIAIRDVSSTPSAILCVYRILAILLTWEMESVTQFAKAFTADRTWAIVATVQRSLQ